MKLSTRARYALRMMLDVARNGADGDPVSLTTVADRTDISRAYLEQVALGLRAARLLRGVSGRRGGYRLAAPPSEITVGQVLEASIGPICLVDCLEDAALCPRSEFCECRLVYGLINKRIADVLQAYTLADLLDPGRVRELLGVEGADVGNGRRTEGGGCNPSPRHAEEEKPEETPSRR
jgi:Rrf2 family protein